MAEPGRDDNRWSDGGHVLTRPAAVKAQRDPSLTIVLSGVEMSDPGPEGLTDRDRAQIEAARQTASGCTFGAGCLTAGVAGLLTLGGIVMMYLMAGEPGVLVIAAIIGLCWLAAIGFFWISKQ